MYQFEIDLLFWMLLITLKLFIILKVLYYVFYICHSSNFHPRIVQI